MHHFTQAEQDVIDAQGWDSDSLVSVLASWDPKQGDRVEHMRSIAATENETDWEDDVPGCSCGMADYGAPGHDGHGD